MSIPVTIKAFVGVILTFEPEKFRELRVASFDLLAGGIAVVSQVIAAVASRGHVNQTPESSSGVSDPCSRVRGVKIEDDACIRFFRPREKALGVLLNQTNRAVNQVYVVSAEIVSGFI